MFDKNCICNGNSPQILCLCSCVGSGDITAVLHVLELLKSVISEFPKSALKSTCELVLGLLGIHNMVSTQAL